MSLHAIVDAHNQGFDENMYLDAATRTKVEETGGANFIFVTKDEQSCYSKVKQYSYLQLHVVHLYMLQKIILGLEVEEREVYLRRSKRFCRMWSLWNSSSYFSCWKDCMIMAKKSASQAEWRKWVLLHRNCMKH